jgi:predicted DNA-binding transcriptional regulator AlpA
MDPSRLATVQDLADFFGVPVRTIYAWKAKSTGPTPIRVGKHLRYRWADVNAWLDSQAAA